MPSSFSTSQGREESLEDLEFHTSRQTTLGVELELQIIDPETADLVPGALRILDVCEDEGIEGVAAEFLQSMIEVKTGVCRDATEVRETLFPLLGRVHRIARSLGYDLSVGGTHPFHRPATSAIFPNERYRRIQKQHGWMAYQEAIFGLHVHVGVPDGEKAIGLTNLLVPYLPHLLALSANSPFWQGIDTNFASTRARMFQPSPHAGIPQHCSSWADFRRHCAVLHEGRVLQGTKDLYWDVRPRPQLGTLEFRIFDAPATLSSLLGLTALTRCLVIDGLRLLEERPELASGDARDFWLARENKWLAARYGLQAECVRQPGLAPRTLAEDVGRLLESLRPLARAAGEERFLNAFGTGKDFETGACRQRRLYRETGNWQVVLDDMRSRWQRELTEEIHPSTLLLHPEVMASSEEEALSPPPWPPRMESGASAFGVAVSPSRAAATASPDGRKGRINVVSRPHLFSTRKRT
jgi:carboxylate-amine ligase